MNHREFLSIHLRASVLTLLFLFGLSNINGYAQIDKKRSDYDLKDFLNSENIINQIRDISSAAFEGRELGFDGNTKAEAWLISQFRAYNLKPLPQLDSYSFDFPIRQYSIPDDSSNFLKVNSNIYIDSLITPAFFSSDAEISGNLFVLPETAHQNFEIHKDSITDAVVYVALNDSIDQIYPQPSDFYITRKLQRFGAKAVIFSFRESSFERRLSVSGNPYLYNSSYSIPIAARKGVHRTYQPFVWDELKAELPVIYFKHDIAQAELHNGITVNIRTMVKEGFRRIAKNIIGYRKGYREPGRYIMVTADYDSDGIHPTKGNPYRGGNTSSSALAPMVEMANALQRYDRPTEYSIIFMAINGSERFNAGLQAFISSDLVGTLDIVHHIHLDEIGYSLNPSVSVARVSLSNPTNELIEIAKKSDKISKLSTTFTPVTKHYLPFGILIEGDPYPYKQRVMDSNGTLNYVQIYQTSQYALELIWNLSNPSKN